MEKKKYKEVALFILAIASIVLASFIVNSESFEVKISTKIENYSNTLAIITEFSPTGETNNPIEFNFSINYANLEELICFLTLNKQGSNPNITYFTPSSNQIRYTKDLENGNYIWAMQCSNANNSINNTVSGDFSVNENFSVSLSKEIYLIDGLGNIIGGTGALQITSAKESNMSIKIKRPVLSEYEEKFFGNLKTIEINNSIIQEKGTYLVNVTFYRLQKPVSIQRQFEVASAEINFSKYQIAANEEATIKVDLYSAVSKIKSVILEFGDGSNNVDYVPADFNQKTIDYKHKYSQSGNYTVKMKISLEKSSQIFEVVKKGLYVENLNDNTEPEITLISPANNEEIKNNSITFSYRPRDSAQIKNCTFELYNYTGGIGALDYSKISENLGNNVTVEIGLKDFDSQDYSWNVYCCDNSSNCNEDLEYYRKFKVTLNSTAAKISSGNETFTYYGQKEEVDELIAKIESFIEAQSSYSAEEISVLEDLGLGKESETYRKILKQIDQDLGYHVDIIKENSLKEKTRKEKEAQIEDIKSKAPIGIRVIEKHEFVKNSIAKNLEEIIRDYIQAKGIKADGRTIKKLAQMNEEIQKEIIVSTVVKSVEIEYLDYTKKITLISKKIDIKNDTFNTLLEVIPKELAENASMVTFITKSEVIKEDPIFAISVDDLENEQIVYYLNKQVDFKKIEDTETIIFKEFAVSTKITGFFLLEMESYSRAYLILIIFLFLVASYFAWFYLNKRRIANWKKEENVLRIFSYLKEAERSLERKDLIVAKEKYHQVQEVYPLIPQGCKRYLLKRIKKIRMEIDKKEILSLVKEFEEAKREKRKDDANLLYKKIQPIYKRLPKKYREKVHEKLVI